MRADGLPGHAQKDSMEMIGRKTGDARQSFQRQFLVQVVLDVGQHGEHAAAIAFPGIDHGRVLSQSVRERLTFFALSHAGCCGQF